MACRNASKWENRKVARNIINVFKGDLKTDKYNGGSWKVFCCVWFVRQKPLLRGKIKCWKVSLKPPSKHQ